MGLTASQVLLAGRAAARAADDHRRAADRDRHRDQPRDRRRVRRQRGPRLADLRRDPAERVQDRALRGGRAWPSRSPSSPTRCSSSSSGSRRRGPPGSGWHEGHPRRASRSSRTTSRCCSTRPSSSCGSRRSPLAISIAIAVPLGVLARAHPPRLVRGDQHLQHRPRAAQPRGDRDRHRAAGPRARQRCCSRSSCSPCRRSSRTPMPRSTASTATSSTRRAEWACASARSSSRTELPLALPLLFAGIRTAAVYIVATVPLGALVGTDGGLGEIIANQASYRLRASSPRRSAWRSWRCSSTASSRRCSAS